MKYLGIDYGDKRIGLAVSDHEGKISFPKKVIFNQGRDVIGSIKKFINEEQVAKIIIGLPLGLGGKETEQTRKVKEFASHLRKNVEIFVEFENELLTTHLVEKIPGIKKEHTDEAAAALILQSYLDKL